LHRLLFLHKTMAVDAISSSYDYQHRFCHAKRNRLSPIHRTAVSSPTNRFFNSNDGQWVDRVGAASILAHSGIPTLSLFEFVSAAKARPHLRASGPLPFRHLILTTVMAYIQESASIGVSTPIRSKLGISYCKPYTSNQQKKERKSREVLFAILP
jgi:hypothetical protein